MEYINFDNIEKPSIEPWVIRKNSLVLKGRFYEIPLDQAQTPAQLCTWLGQVASKSWADDRTVAGLVRALNSLVGLRQ